MVPSCRANIQKGNKTSWYDIDVQTFLFSLFDKYSASSLPQLCSTFNVIYTAPVCPHLARNKQQLEKVQCFALKMSSKRWSDRYESLIDWAGLATLEKRRKMLKLCLFGQILHDAVHHNFAPIYREMDSRLRNFSTSEVQVPLTHSRSSEFSFLM